MSVRWSIHPSVCRSIGHTFVKITFSSIFEHYCPCPTVRHWWPCIRLCWSKKCLTCMHMDTRTAQNYRKSDQPTIRPIDEPTVFYMHTTKNINWLGDWKPYFMPQFPLLLLLDPFQPLEHRVDHPASVSPRWISQCNRFCSHKELSVMAAWTLSNQRFSTNLEPFQRQLRLSWQGTSYFYILSRHFLPGLLERRSFPYSSFDFL